MANFLQELVAHLGFKVDHKPLDEVQHRLEGIEKKLSFLGAAEVVRGIVELTERFGGWAGQLQNAAASAGVTVEKFQAMAYAGSQSGVSAEEMGSGLTFLTRQLYSAREGSKEALESFAALGISQAQIAGFKTSADALDAVSDSIARMEDPVKKQALVVKLLGRGSSNMIRMMSAGSQKFGELQANAVKFGAVLRNDQVAAINEAGDALETFWLLMKTAAATIAATVAPIVETLAHYFIELYGAIHTATDQNLEDWGVSLGYALGFIAGFVGECIKLFAGFVKEHKTLIFWGGILAGVLGAVGLGAGLTSKALELVATGLGSLVRPLIWTWGLIGGLQGGLGKLIAKLGLMAVEYLPAVGTALFELGTAIMSTPVGAFAVGVGIAIATFAALKAVWDHFVNGVPWGETGIGKFFAAFMEKYRLIKKFLGFGEDVPATEGAPAALTPTGQPEGPYAEPSLGGAAGPPIIENILDARNRALAMPAAGAAAPTAALPTPESYHMNAPITLVIPSSADPKEMASAAERGVQKHFDRVLRDAQRAHKPAEVN